LPLRLLFVFRNRKAVEPFAGVVRRCLERGHAVHVAVPASHEKVQAQFEPHSELSFGSFGMQRADEWRASAPLFRSARDYLQYLRPPYIDARKLRRRAFGYLVERLGMAPVLLPADSAEFALSLPEESKWNLERLAAAVEDGIESDILHERFISSFKPDAVLVSPLLHFGSAQADVVKSARALGIPVGALLFSWDNLSTKGALHVRPDRLFVWNERQRREAAELHGIASGDVSITGAPRFDAFFALSPRVSRDAFCAALGFDPVRPVVLYLCSSKLVSERESSFIRQWHAVIRRSSHQSLRQANLIVRPHPDLPVKDKKWLGPEQTARWDERSGPELHIRRMFGDPGAVMLYSESDRTQMLYESIYHSRAVVGLNTSAEIEAAIVGRPVFTILTDEESADGQQSTLHFKYLLKDEGGFVVVSPSLSEHERVLAGELSEALDSTSIQARVGSFVRPLGWGRLAADALVEAIERELSGVRPAAAGARGRIAGRPAPFVASPSIDRRLPRGEPARVTRVGYDDADIMIAAASEREVAAAAVGTESPSILTWLDAVVRPGQVVYVVPGGIGVLALVAARGLGATVFAFEGNIPSLARLWENAVLNGCEGTLVPMPVALGSERMLQKQRCASASPGARHEFPVRNQWHPHREVDADVVQPCATLTLDGAVRTWALPVPETICISRDARAAHVLSGAARTLETAVRTILVECDETDVDAARAAAAAVGFSLAERQQQPASVALRFVRA
jgi:hypothetical protein